jgi:hypothetical protein
MARKIHEVIELWYRGVFVRFDITLKLGWDGLFDWDALSLGRGRYVEVMIWQ